MDFQGTMLSFQGCKLILEPILEAFQKKSFLEEWHASKKT